MYKRMFYLLTGRRISFGNFMVLTGSAVRRLVSMQELPLHVAGTVLAAKLRVGICPLDRGARYSGRSRMNFVGLVLHGFKGLMVFAEDVLVRVGIVSVGIALFAMIAAVVAVVLKLLGIATPGWFSILIGVLLLIFLQTGALTLTTLMLSGVVRGGTVTSTLAYRNFVDEIILSRIASNASYMTTKKSHEAGDGANEPQPRLGS